MKVVIVEVQSLPSGKILVQWYIAIQQTVAVAKVESIKHWMMGINMARRLFQNYCNSL